ncbi:transglycosylase SLT domain-containing protein [Lichenicoccus sp.]|uniref:lytic transglycosylase domain-containing protein n=1 Tax=Lichenicoccus sp. TaxID=2781899 RepID=UPI003D0C2626
MLVSDQAGPLVETAFAMPRAAARAGINGWRDDEIGVVRPLPSNEAARIRQIFAWQARGQFTQATRAIQALPDDMLLADMLAARYLSPKSSPDAASLRQWLHRWPDAADADAIRRRLAALRPAFHRNPLLDRTVRARLGRGAAGARSALRLVARTRFIDRRYAGDLRAEIARASFADGDDASAIRAARGAITDGAIGRGGLVAGLAAWRRGNIRQAEGFFEQAWHAALTQGETRAGTAFWAARAAQRLGDPQSTDAWLRRAAESPDSFYGMLASTLLQAPQAAVTEVAYRPKPTLGEADLAAVAAAPAGRRALALLQVGQRARAEATLLNLRARVREPGMRRAIDLVARTAGLDRRPACPSAALAMPTLRPARGFTVDPALVYAVTRVESNFDSRAVSAVGAHGLMQIMPATANALMGRPRRGRSATQAMLRDPGRNLEVGQRYLRALAARPDIDNDLIRLLASYNAGPSALAHWSVALQARDPLLFIETLPATETRDFVHRTLRDLWLYAEQMQRPTPSLQTLAQGGWPRFDAEPQGRDAG